MDRLNGDFLKKSYPAKDERQQGVAQRFHERLDNPRDESHAAEIRIKTSHVGPDTFPTFPTTK
jgi:hypothetical protein